MVWATVEEARSGGDHGAYAPGTAPEAGAGWCAATREPQCSMLFQYMLEMIQAQCRCELFRNWHAGGDHGLRVQKASYLSLYVSLLACDLSLRLEFSVPDYG